MSETKLCGRKELKEKWQGIWQICRKKNDLLKRKKNKDEKGEKRKHLIREVTRGKKGGGENGYRITRILWMLPHGFEIDWKSQVRGNWFPSLIFWMDQTKVWQKKNRTKNNELVALKITLSVCKEKGLVDKEKLKSPVMTEMSERGQNWMSNLTWLLDYMVLLPQNRK